MTALELEKKRMKLLKKINSEHLHNKAGKYTCHIKKNQNTLPRQYKTIEELNNSIEQAETELRNGGGYTTTEAKEKIKKYIHIVDVWDCRQNPKTNTRHIK